MDIQQEFNTIFPFLNLEFFDLSQDALSTYTNTGDRYPDVLIGDLRDGGHAGDLIIYPGMTIMQLEHQLYEEFGLKAQVFMRTGNNWTRTSLNGYWLLFHKNEEGRRSCQTLDNAQESV
jgi:hypothetical protein